MHLIRPWYFPLLGALMVPVGPESRVQAANGVLTLTVVDEQSGRVLPCRVYLTGPSGKPRTAGNYPFWHDHFASDGRLRLRLPVGTYQFAVERGPEFTTRWGSFTLGPGARDAHQVELRRVVTMAEQGWYSGDMDLQRPLRDVERVLLADDLHVGQVVTWQIGTGRRSSRAPATSPPPQESTCLIQNGAGLVRSRDNAFMVYGAQPRVDSLVYADELPRDFAAQFSPSCWIDAHPASWDLPIWIACGQVDSIRIADEFVLRQGQPKGSPPGRPRDLLHYPDPQGHARWLQDVYFQLLNCGLRLPPTAGSGSGRATNPAGYNRLYAHLDGPLTPENWWNALRAGRLTVTNGPLLAPKVRGESPGHVFHLESGDKLQLEIGLDLATRERIDYVEILRDGRVDRGFRLDDYGPGSRLPALEFTSSGWFLVRAVTEQVETYRFGITAPYFVDVDGEAMRSRRSAEFFLEWTRDREEMLQTEGGARWERLEPHVRRAIEFWRERMQTANAP